MTAQENVSRPAVIRAWRTHVAALLLGFGVTGACAGACGQRAGFDDPSQRFNAADAGDCSLQCSLDGRSIVRSCDGAIVETCRADLACGDSVCQEPCAAATAERSSNGCAFYLQPPHFKKWLYDRSCYAAYVVNTSSLPVELTVELEGNPLDLSKSTYRAEPGSARLVPHTGPLPPGETVVVFLSDRAADEPTTGNEDGLVVPCPEGVVPATYVDALPEGTGIGSSFHLTTNVPVSATAVYPFGGGVSFSAPTATLLLPVATWGKEHLIINAWDGSSNTGSAESGPAAQIVASEDDTEVTIRPTRAIKDGMGVVGTPAGVPATYRFGKGQLLQIDQPEELTGSIVSSNKPTSIFGGHECLYIPWTRKHCDFALQEIPAFEQWGSEYVGVGYRPRLGDEHEPMPYRIVAARDGTRLEYEPAAPPGAPLTMSAGQVVTFWTGVSDAFVVRTQDAEHPIYVAAYMSGGGGAPHPDFPEDVGFEANGDPEFVNVIPAGQYLNSYSLYADPSYQETSLVIVRAKTYGGFKDVWLECAGNVEGFRPIGTSGQYEYRRVDLTRGGGPGEAFGTSVCQAGLQRLRSDGAFTVTLWGWSRLASYAYPGGMAQRKLVQTPLAVR